jgi:LmbE family N-acetylglucosaminyl deacetylase
MLLGIVGSLAWVGARTASYQELLSYPADHDYRYDLSQTEGQRIEVELEGDGFRWPPGIERWDTGFLEMRVEASLAGVVHDPCLAVEAGGKQFRQYLERRVKGLRYLNLSPLAKLSLQADTKVTLQGDRLSWPRQRATLVLYRNTITPLTRVLVVAPHPDDAEIAAFGLYSHRDSYVVTLTAGEAGEGFNIPFQENGRRRQIILGKVRAWDSIAVPIWGGLDLDRACNLGYFDGTLSWMYHHPELEATSPSMHSSDLKMFRRCPWTGPIADERPKATWRNLVSDLAYVLKSIKPQVIVLPHPLLEVHPDHRYAALAVFQAISESGLSQGELFLYTNRHVLTPMYPFGNDDGLVSLPPWFGEAWMFSRVYSYQLHPGQKSEKYFALDSMHNLRGASGTQHRSLGFLALGLAKAVDEVLGLEGVFNYFQRANRPNELFFVVPLCQTPRLAQEAEKARQAIGAS